MDRLVGSKSPWWAALDETIEQELKTAKCLMVIWSANSVGNRWVRTEADEGLKRHILVPVAIDDAEIPLAFRLIQIVDLSNWAGGSEVARTQELNAAVNRVLQSAPTADITGQRTKPGPVLCDQSDSLASIIRDHALQASM
jgi:hypothetical protein